MTAGTSVDVNRPLTIFSIALLASITPSAVLLGPLVVGALVTDLGFSPQQGGNMIFAELGGAAFATFPAFWWLTNVNWRKVLYLALGLTIVGNLVSATVSDPWTLGMVRFGTGIGVGTIMLVTLTTVGLTANQERVFGFWQTGQIIFAAIALFTMPFVIPVVGVHGFYVSLAIVMAILATVVRNFPEAGAARSGFRWSELAPQVRRLAPLALIGLIFFYIAVGGVWNFVERMGDAAGFDPKFIGYTLAGVSVVGVAGALTATWLSTRLGRIIPFAAGILIIAASFVLLYGLSSQSIFILSAFLFKYGWWFISPYLLANMTTLDPTGRLITATNFVIAFGQALGPLVVGFMLVESASGKVTDYSPALTIGLVAFAICCLFFAPVVRTNNRLLTNRG
jgi:predicted MFS family arabinose efflux permease